MINYLNTDNLYSTALDVVESFREIVSNRSTQSLDEYLKIYKSNKWANWIKLREFMNGVERDIIAVTNQINEKITNSTTEGFVSKIKTNKFQIRGNLIGNTKLGGENI